MELVVLRGFHYWSKATVTLCMSVSAATLFSPKTIVISDINTNQCSVYCINRCVYCVPIIIQTIVAISTCTNVNKTTITTSYKYLSTRENYAGTLLSLSRQVTNFDPAPPVRFVEVDCRAVPSSNS